MSKKTTLEQIDVAAMTKEVFPASDSIWKQFNMSCPFIDIVEGHADCTIVVEWYDISHDLRCLIEKTWRQSSRHKNSSPLKRKIAKENLIWELSKVTSKARKWVNKNEFAEVVKSQADKDSKAGLYTK